MKFFCGLIFRKLHIIFILIAFLIFGCGKEELPTEANIQGEPVESEEIIVEKLPQLSNRDAKGYYDFGVETIKKGNFGLAVQAWNKAVEIDPTMLKAYNYLGRAYYTQGMMEEAITVYKKSVELEPDNPNAHVNLGVSYRYEEMYDEAIEEFNKAIDINPLSPLAYDEIGMALSKQKKYDEAIAAHKNAIAIDSESPQPHNHLGVVYLLKGMTKEASAEFELFQKLTAAKKLKQAKIMGGPPH